MAKKPNSATFDYENYNWSTAKTLLHNGVKLHNLAYALDPNGNTLSKKIIFQAVKMGYIQKVVFFNGVEYPKYITPYTLPTVTTDSSIGGFSGDLSADGTIISDGGTDIIERGFVWNAAGNPTILDYKYIDPLAVIGTFSMNQISAIYGTVYVKAYAINSVGISYGDEIEATIFVCLAKGTLVTLGNRTTKAIEDISYSDEILVWNFDEGVFTTSTPLYIKKSDIANKYNLLEFSDGSYLKTIVQHRIFNKEKGKFTYPMTDDTPIGTHTFNVYGEEIVLIKKEVIVEEIEYYNVITNYHMNLFGNGILTSIGYNNLYPIENMKFIKDNRNLIPIEEFKSIPNKYYHGLRLGEQIDIPIENSIDYITKRESIALRPVEEKVMNEINLKLETKIVNCEVRKIKSAITFEECVIETIIPKKHKKRLEKLLIEEIKNSK